MESRVQHSCCHHDGADMALDILYENVTESSIVSSVRSDCSDVSAFIWQKLQKDACLLLKHWFAVVRNLRFYIVHVDEGF